MSDTKQSGSLSELVQAMDAVDTLRRRDRLLKRELTTERAEDLRERLKNVYSEQGIAVPDSVLEQAITNMEQARYRYIPLADGVNRKLAMFYIHRGYWATRFTVAIIALIAIKAFIGFAT